MLVRRHSSGWEVWAPAKLNLFLEVLGRRGDGFHELETLMCPINVYDTLYFRDDPEGRIWLTCESVFGSPPLGAAEDALPEGTDNIVVRAVHMLREATGVARGARIRLIKRIPIAAGLAGGSSDAAAALLAANRQWKLDLTRQQLAQIGSELGSDVPFFFAGGAAVCRGRGERVEPVRAETARANSARAESAWRSATFHLVVVTPPGRLLTADVFRNCRPADRPQALTPLLRAVIEGDQAGVGRLLHNRLQPAAEQLSPWVAQLHDVFRRMDVLGHQMSGSGTSYFGLCRHARHCQRVAKSLAAQVPGNVYVVRTGL